MHSRWFHILPLLAALLVLTPGCEDDDYDHVPPSGKGALYIDNETRDDIDVFVDGTNRGHVGDYDERAFDLDPALYRVVLVDRDGDHSYRDDIDILADRLSILRVNTGIDGQYDVSVRFE